MSVIVPVYNAERTLARSLQSAIAQTLPNIEVIASDDASQDGSVAILEALARADERLIVLRSGVNRGPAAARNRALDAARGDWVVILDADDWYAPERLETLLTLAERTGAEFLVDNQFLYDAQAGALLGSGLSARSGFAPLSLDDLLRNSITGKSPYDYGLLQPMIRRSFLADRGIRYVEDCRFGEDFLLALDCLAENARGVLCYEPMYYVTQPHGVRSGAPSRPDRQAYDYEAMRRFNDIAASRYEGRMTPGQIRLLRRRSESIRRYARYVALTSGGRRRPWRLAAALWRPSLWPYLCRTVLRNLRLLLCAPEPHRPA